MDFALFALLNFMAPLAPGSSIFRQIHRGILLAVGSHLAAAPPGNSCQRYSLFPNMLRVPSRTHDRHNQGSPPRYFMGGEYVPLRVFNSIAGARACNDRWAQLAADAYTQVYANHTPWSSYEDHNDYIRKVLITGRAYPIAIRHQGLAGQAEGGYSTEMPNNHLFAACPACEKSPRLFAHGASAVIPSQFAPLVIRGRDVTKWCSICVWKLSNSSISRLCIFRLWPRALPAQVNEIIAQFLATEGRRTRLEGQSQHGHLLITPHLCHIYRQARQRAWHSVLLVGYRHAMLCLALMKGGLPGACARNRVPERAWTPTFLHFLCCNPFWRLLICATTSYHNRNVPVLGLPFQVLLSYLGDTDTFVQQQAWRMVLTRHKSVRVRLLETHATQ